MIYEILVCTSTVLGLNPCNYCILHCKETELMYFAELRWGVQDFVMTFKDFEQLYILF